MEQLGGLGQDGVDVEMPAEGFYKQQHFGGLLQHGGRNISQAKLGVGEIAVIVVIRRAVKSVQPPDDL